MNKYIELKTRHQKEFNDFPLGAAFGDKQFEEMMKKWGLDAKKTSDLEKVSHVCSGIYILKTDIPAYKDMNRRHSDELKTEIANDKTGDGFIYDMFYHELCNHEYGYTGNLADTLNALGYTPEQINADKRLLHGLQKASSEIMKGENVFSNGKPSLSERISSAEAKKDAAVSDNRNRDSKDIENER